MKITALRTTPLLVHYKKTYHWAQGVIDGAEVILVEVETDDGVTGYGECIGSPSSSAVQSLLRIAGDICIGHSPFENARLMRKAYHALFAALGTCSAPRFSGQILAGLEMALWDVAGKATGCAVHELLGGAVRDDVQYFGFPQGDTAEELAGEARTMAEAGFPVIYVKIGRGERLDLAIAEQVRAAIGERRLRLDANEAWDPLTAVRMIRKLAAFDIEFIEQPTTSESLSALAQIRAASPIAIAADQLVFTPANVFDVCRHQAADVIVLGLHETGGIGRFRAAASIAEAAGLNICVHGLYETGITTCAANQAAATVANLDDGNQYMNHLLKEDIIAGPSLELKNGKLPVLQGPGLGFELDWDAVGRATEAHEKRL
jgi:L-alanine-DL-glutamate epimerase-like enolase superfamily enzyme